METLSVETIQEELDKTLEAGVPLEGFTLSEISQSVKYNYDMVSFMCII